MRGLGLNRIIGLKFSDYFCTKKRLIHDGNRLDLSPARLILPGVSEGPFHAKTQVMSHRPKRHILHIEDNEAYAVLIKRVLESRDYEVTQASDGLSGLIAFNKNMELWKAVLLDLNLPHLSGSALLEEMHRLRPDIPLIVLTGDTSDANLKLYEKGAVILWHKPVSATDLIENLEALLK